MSYFSRLCAYPLKCHPTGIKTVFRYRARTYSISPKYKRSPTSVPWSILPFPDSKYASCRNTRHSVSVYSFTLNGCSIYWLCRKQQAIACTTIEAEYLALATTSGQAVRYFDAFIQHGYSVSLTIVADETASINIKENAINHLWTKDIAITPTLQQNIFCFIPLPDAVYHLTTTLATKWRNDWTLLASMHILNVWCYQN